MYCTRCNNEMNNCTCLDKAQRLNSLGQSNHVAVKWCRKCNQHYAVCFCEQPDFTVMIGGRDMGKGPHKMLDGSTIIITNER
jgi:hypothetical protein